MEARAFITAQDLRSVPVQHCRTRPTLIGASGDNQAVPAKRNRHSVVRRRQLNLLGVEHGTSQLAGINEGHLS